MDDIRVICIPLGKYLIITVNKNASSTLIELAGVGNELFASITDLPDLLAQHTDKTVVGILRDPMDRYASGLLEEVKRTLKAYTDFLLINNTKLESLAQSNDFWKRATEIYFEIQGEFNPNWSHATQGYTAHCGNWLSIFDHIPNTRVKYVLMGDLNKFLASIGYTDVKTYNKTSDQDYVIRLGITVKDLNKRFAEEVVPSLGCYADIVKHLELEYAIYNRLKNASSKR
jgi:hypothetical protein